MRSLRLVKSTDSDSGGAVVLQSEDGEQFELVMDDSLRGALGGALGSAARETPTADTPKDEPPATPVPPRTVVALSPRDIQVRVRSGESPEDLAAETGNPLDRIMRFATAVLQERSRVGDEARRARARRDGDGGLVPFGETVDRQFAAHDVDPQAVTWDAFRRPDGTWVVTAAWSMDGNDRQAQWTFSLAGRTVLPADNTAADLLSERPLRPVVRAVPDAADASPQIGEAVYDQETAGYARPRQEQSLGYHGAAVDGPLEGGVGGAGRRSAEARATQTRASDAQANDAQATDARETDAWETDTRATDARETASRTAGGPAGMPRRTAPKALRLADPLPPPGADEPESARPGTEQQTTTTSADRLDGDGDGDGEAALFPADPGVDPDGAGADGAAAEEAGADGAGADGAATDAAPRGKRGAGRGRAAREQTKIPSWDDILLGVRRHQD